MGENKSRREEERRGGTEMGNYCMSIMWDGEQRGSGKKKKWLWICRYVNACD